VSPDVLFRETFTVHGNDFEHGGNVAAAIKATLRELGIASDAIRRLSIANFEAEMNVIMYARRAEFLFTITPDLISVLVTDEGPGIPDVEWAMQEGHSTATPEMRERGFGAGLGLPNIRKNSDEFAIESTVGTGTTLRYAVRISPKA
jgi:serine/threonine-protein kinase RsbT